VGSPTVQQDKRSRPVQFSEDNKDSQVFFYGKNILYNADGSSNLAKIEECLEYKTLILNLESVPSEEL
jgi:hypothetical protein